MQMGSLPPHLPIRFTADLSLASQVAYDPSACPLLLGAEAYTVQAAIDNLCKMQRGGGCAVTVGVYINLALSLTI
jgi:hypothetical protein